MVGAPGVLLVEVTELKMTPLVTVLAIGSLVGNGVGVGSPAAVVDVLSVTVNEAVPLLLGSFAVDGLAAVDEVADVTPSLADSEMLDTRSLEDLAVVAPAPELGLDAPFDDVGGSEAVTYTVVDMKTVVVKREEQSTLFCPSKAAAPAASPPRTRKGADKGQAEIPRILSGIYRMIESPKAASYTTLLVRTAQRLSTLGWSERSAHDRNQVGEYSCCSSAEATGY